MSIRGSFFPFFFFPQKIKRTILFILKPQFAAGVFIIQLFN